MNLEHLPIGKNPPHEVNVVVEVPVGGEPIKYEIHKPSGALMVDRFLYTAMRYPGNYGFIPHTLSDDGDPCDVVIANQRGLMPGAVLAVRPVGVLKMQDEAGGDEKIIAVPVPKLTLRYEHVHNYTDLPDITLQQIQHFFEHYKDLEPGKWMKVLGWGDAAEARDLISAAIALLLRRPCKAPGDPEFEDRRLAIVDVAKHRNGPTGEVRLDFDDGLTRFGDRADQGGETEGLDPEPNPEA